MSQAMSEALAWTALGIAFAALLAFAVTLFALWRNPVRAALFVCFELLVGLTAHLVAPAVHVSASIADGDTAAGQVQYGGSEPGIVFIIFAIGIMILFAISLAYNAQAQVRNF